MYSLNTSCNWFDAEQQVGGPIIGVLFLSGEAWACFCIQGVDDAMIETLIYTEIITQTIRPKYKHIYPWFIGVQCCVKETLFVKKLMLSE